MNYDELDLSERCSGSGEWATFYGRKDSLYLNSSVENGISVKPAAVRGYSQHCPRHRAVSYFRPYCLPVPVGTTFVLDNLAASSALMIVQHYTLRRAAAAGLNTLEKRDTTTTVKTREIAIP